MERSSVKLTLELECDINLPILIFVHGFNNSESDAISVFAEMINAKNQDGEYLIQGEFTFACMLWASTANYKVSSFFGNVMKRCGSLFGKLFPQIGEEISREWNIGFFPKRYVEDLDRITESFEDFYKILNDLSSKGHEIHLIAHSLGCKMLVNYIGLLCHDYKVRQAGEYSNGKPENCEVLERRLVHVKSVIMIAPDVNIGIFKEYVKSNVGLLWKLSNTKLIIFANNLDVAIFASKYIIRVDDKPLGNADDANGVVKSISLDLKSVNAIEIVNVNIAESFFGPTHKHFPVSHNYYTDVKVLEHISSTVNRKEGSLRRVNSFIYIF